METSIIIIALLILLSISISVFFWFKISELEKKKSSEHDKMVRNTNDQIRKANENAKRVIKQANAKAETYEQAVEAMKNIIDGYGNEHLVSKTVFDDLAGEFSHKKAGMELKQARLLTNGLVIGGRAALSDYPEYHQKMAAIRFILDAFNGKVDSTLARIKYDNYGKLEAEITVGFGLVNGNGRVFGNTRITNEYLKARLCELKWAAAVDELENPQGKERSEAAKGIIPAAAVVQRKQEVKAYQEEIKADLAATAAYPEETDVHMEEGEVYQEEVAVPLGETAVYQEEVAVPLGETVAYQEEVAVHQEAIAVSQEALAVHQEEVEFYQEELAVPLEEAQVYQEAIAVHQEEVEFYQEELAVPVEETEVYQEEIAVHQEEVEFYQEELAVPLEETEVYQEEVQTRMTAQALPTDSEPMLPQSGKMVAERTENKVLPVENESLSARREVEDVLRASRKEDRMFQEAMAKTRQKITAQRSLADSGRMPPRPAKPAMEKLRHEDLAAKNEQLRQKSFRARKEAATSASQITAIREEIFQPATFQRPSKTRLVKQPAIEQVKSIG